MLLLQKCGLNGNIFERQQHQAFIRQRSLKRFCLIPWRIHPHIHFLSRRQHYGHCLGMDRFDDVVRLAGQKPNS